jgi:hypothetical protein
MWFVKIFIYADIVDFFSLALISVFLTRKAI